MTILLLGYQRIKYQETKYVIRPAKMVKKTLVKREKYLDRPQDFAMSDEHSSRKELGDLRKLNCSHTAINVQYCSSQLSL